MFKVSVHPIDALIKVANSEALSEEPESEPAATVNSKPAQLDRQAVLINDVIVEVNEDED